MSCICFITAIYSDPTLTCKPFVKQSISTDFICFTDNHSIDDCGWKLDTFPYHNGCKTNAIKFYKQAFNQISTLQKYDVIVWIDASIEIIWCKVSEYIMKHIQKNKIICWQHTKRYDMLDEVKASSKLLKYSVDSVNHVFRQYQSYLEEGFDTNYGVWLTCFIAFLHKDRMIKELLMDWYQQTLIHTNQDRISFSYVCFKNNIGPLTLPNSQIYGIPYSSTQFYVKHDGI